jgi:hypothetical protein
MKARGSHQSTNKCNAELSMAMHGGVLPKEGLERANPKLYFFSFCFQEQSISGDNSA